jgi:hypothetical protein
VTPNVSSALTQGDTLFGGVIFYKFKPEKKIFYTVN